MKRFIAVGGMSLLVVGLAVGLALAAAGPGAGGRGPGPGGPGMGVMRPGGPPPGGPGMGGGQFAPGEPRPGGPPQGGPGGQGMQRQGPPPLVPALEQKMGKPLTAEQKTQIGDAAKTEHEALQPIREAFAKKVAEVTGLPLEKVLPLLPPGPPPGPGARGGQGPGAGGGPGGPPAGGQPAGGPGLGGPGQGGPGQGGPPPLGAILAKRIEQALGKPLTEEQLGQFRDADKASLEAAKPVHEAFLGKLAQITGLSVDDVNSAIPRRGPPPMPPQGPPKGPPPAPLGGAQQ